MKHLSAFIVAFALLILVGCGVVTRGGVLNPCSSERPCGQALRHKREVPVVTRLAPVDAAAVERARAACHVEATCTTEARELLWRAIWCSSVALEKTEWRWTKRFPFVERVTVYESICGRGR